MVTSAAATNCTVVSCQASSKLDPDLIFILMFFTHAEILLKKNKANCLKIHSLNKWD